MKKLSQFERAVLAVTAAFALFACGYFAAGQRPSDAWRVEVQRSENAGEVSSQQTGRPDSLLEGEIIDINTATATELERLPGIGAVRARDIVTDREKNGLYGSLDDLARVSGIGAGIVEELRPYAAAG